MNTTNGVAHAQKTWREKVGLAEMLKGGVIMDVVTPSRRRSPKTPARSPSWPLSASLPTSAPRAASPA